MAETETTEGVTIGGLTRTTTMSATDLIEIERGGQAYSVTYESLVAELEDSLGLVELATSLAQIIG